MIHLRIVAAPEEGVRAHAHGLVEVREHPIARKPFLDRLPQVGQVPGAIRVTRRRRFRGGPAVGGGEGVPEGGNRDRHKSLGEGGKQRPGKRFRADREARHEQAQHPRKLTRRAGRFRVRDPRCVAVRRTPQSAAEHGPQSRDAVFAFVHARPRPYLVAADPPQTRYKDDCGQGRSDISSGLLNGLSGVSLT